MHNNMLKHVINNFVSNWALFLRAPSHRHPSQGLNQNAIRGGHFSLKGGNAPTVLRRNCGAACEDHIARDWKGCAAARAIQDVQNKRCSTRRTH
eukprot:5482223-Amphidinium_carterae.1